MFRLLAMKGVCPGYLEEQPQSVSNILCTPHAGATVR